MSSLNLQQWYNRADDDDKSEGLLAYARYNHVMRMLAEHYGFALDRVVACFAALSPNLDYLGNLRSCASVLRGINMGANVTDIRTAGYNHARDRSFLYATGERQFLDHAKGLKTRAFYKNLMNPNDVEPVCIDGHMLLAYVNERRPLKQAVVSKSQYREVAAAVRDIAADLSLVPNQVQATIWFAPSDHSALCTTRSLICSATTQTNGKRS